MLKTLEGGADGVCSTRCSTAFGSTPAVQARTPTRCCRRCCRSYAAARARTPTAGRCCSASTACASSATARPSAQAMLNAIKLAHEMVEHGWSTRSAPRSRSTRDRWSLGCTALARPANDTGSVTSVPAETDVEQVRSTATRSSRSCATNLADILEIEPVDDHRGPVVRRRPRRRLARADRTGRGARGGARRAHVGFRIEDEDLVDLKTVRDAVDYVYARVREA